MPRMESVQVSKLLALWCQEGHPPQELPLSLQRPRPFLLRSRQQKKKQKLKLLLWPLLPLQHPVWLQPPQQVQLQPPFPLLLAWLQLL